ncbi:hypothetical protein LTR08_001425 [Meristemomyces frigidus]|nr:hypothetical protein LTR08_001425 [Meristemomyces frigidus]
MDTVKDALGLGAKTHSGQEPVSGQQGQGTADAPYDAGNDANPDLGGKAPQHTDASKTTGDLSKSVKEAAGTSGQQK